MLFGKNSSSTFKGPTKNHKTSKRANLSSYAMATIGSGDLSSAVKLPEGEDQNEWIAAHIVDFTNQVNMLYGTMQEYCTPVTCPTMSAGNDYQYYWADGVTVKKAIPVSAPEYVDLLMSWIQNLLDDEELFPNEINVPFPKSFKKVSKQIFKRLFRVYAHLYHHHSDSLSALGIFQHVNTSFKHFVLFCREMNLVDEKEFGPLASLISELIR
ncbi:hypothetical protein GEMRC1_010845 [Eukaryota sp. GEM-RC1]